VDQVLHADHAVLAEVLLDDGVISQRNALLVDLAISALVNKLLDRLEVGIAVGDPWLDHLDHLRRGLGDLDKDAVVDLEQAKELKDLTGLGGYLADTLDADDKDQLGLSRNVGLAVVLRNTCKADLVLLGIAVLLDILFSTLEDDRTPLLVGLLLLLELSSTLGTSLLLAFSLLQKSLRE
jgi:hypothetical protein